MLGAIKPFSAENQHEQRQTENDKTFIGNSNQPIRFWEIILIKINKKLYSASTITLSPLIQIITEGERGWFSLRRYTSATFM
jgi:hypothetical protein